MLKITSEFFVKSIAKTQKYCYDNDELDYIIEILCKYIEKYRKEE